MEPEMFAEGLFAPMGGVIIAVTLWVGTTGQVADSLAAVEARSNKLLKAWYDLTFEAQRQIQQEAKQKQRLLTPARRFTFRLAGLNKASSRRQAETLVRECVSPEEYLTIQRLDRASTNWMFILMSAIVALFVAIHGFVSYLTNVPDAGVGSGFIVAVIAFGASIVCIRRRVAKETKVLQEVAAQCL